jgi:tight adherence protein B
VAVLAERLGALLRSGLGEDQAWRALAERDDPVAALARTVVGTRSLGGDTAEGLRRAHGQQHGREHGPQRRRRGGPSSPELAWLALAWEVSQVCGAPLTAVLDGIAATIRAEADADRARRTALAGPRATATVLTWLPLGGLGLGLLIGADVIEVLLTTGAGRVCLALGAGLWWAGRAWTGRLVHRATTDRA